VQSAAAYSSNIGGNSMGIDTYLKNKRSNVKSKAREMTEIDNLVRAYNYAVSHELSQQTLLEARTLSSKHLLLLKSQRGKVRNQQVGIFSYGKIDYMAAEASDVQAEPDKLFADIAYLRAAALSREDVFYYASVVHLLFEKIHPFMDGNGRAGRLLEKWFSSANIGEAAWATESEKYHVRHRPSYY